MTRTALLPCASSLLAALALGGCVDGAQPVHGTSAEPSMGAAAQAVATATPYEERIVLELVNSASEQTLDEDARLDSRAARNIVAHRAGPDGVDGTADDDRFDSWAELDAISYVGDTALALLVDYALTIYGPEEVEEVAVLVHGVAEGSPAAIAMLVLANGLSEAELDEDVALDSRAAGNIVAAREGGAIASLTELDTIAYVGGAAFDRLYDYGLDQGHIREEGCSDGLVWIAGGGEFESPAAATSAADPGDVVYLCAGSWTEQVSIETRIQLVGLEGAAHSVIDADEAGSALTVNAADVTVSGLTLTGGRGGGAGAMTGGGVHVGHAADGFTLRDAIVTGNRADSGGGLALEADATLERVTVSDNQASGSYGQGGAIVVYSARLTGIDLVLSDNVAKRGGALYLYHPTSEAELEGGTIEGNEATGGWGGGVFAAGPIHLTDTTIDGNTADRGAGVYLSAEGTSSRLDGAVLSRNAAASGNGALALSRGTLEVANTDWGAGLLDNSPNDLVGYDGGWTALTTTSTFRCVATSGDVRCSY